VDLLPTLLEIAAPDALSGLSLDGRSFLPALTGGEQEGCEEAVATFHTTKVGRSYEMRAIYRGRWAYIWNPWSDGITAFHSASETGLAMQALREAARTEPQIAARVQQLLFRAQEELYDFDTDRNSLVDLARDPAYASDLAALRERLGRWMKHCEDPLCARFAARPA